MAQPQSQAWLGVRWCRGFTPTPVLLLLCPCPSELPPVLSVPVMPFSCPSGGIVVLMSPLAALAPFQPQPSGMTRSFDSSSLNLTAQVWDSGAQQKLHTWHRHLGFLPSPEQVESLPRLSPQARSFVALAQPGVPAGCDPVPWWGH